ncbi:MAG: PAAR domain-containing protein [Candidatus Verstraetearchaeota archaeon]|nr:PAAR domain-containing protein [Candidatus Verstraetearchaeota archaeon]
MGKPAAKLGDTITATDTHIVMMPSPGGPIPTPMPFPFLGVVSGELSKDVMINGVPAATVGSTAINAPPHIPPAPGTFQKPPSNQAKIITGSSTVLINGKPAARSGDIAVTCNDPVDLPVGTVISSGNVFIG